MTTELDRLFQTFVGFPFDNTTHRQSYPPYNLYKEGNHYFVELAVAGYDKNDISITLEKGVLSIVGEKQPQRASEDRVDYHIGISSKKFHRNFTIHKDLEIKNAYMDDGLLVVCMEVVIPEEDKPRSIPIL